MQRLEGYQRRYLRSLAHSFKPAVYIGQKGLSGALLDALSDALDRHELVKVKFVDFKDKQAKSAMIEQIERTLACATVGMIGHMVTFYRPQADPEKRRIALPRRSDA